MEEEVKEVPKTEDVCKKDGFYMKYNHFHGCAGHHVARIFLKIVIIFAIFSIGVSVGSHMSRNREFRSYDRFNNERGGWIMQNDRFRGQASPDQYNYGYGQMMGGQIQVQAPIQSIPATTIQVVPAATATTPAPAKVVTPVK